MPAGVPRAGTITPGRVGDGYCPHPTPALRGWGFGVLLLGFFWSFFAVF